MKKVALGVVALLVVLALGYAISSQVWGFPLFGSAPKQQTTHQAKSSMVTLGEFTTNLMDPGRYIKVTVDVEIFSDANEEFSNSMSEFKTDIYGLLRSKTYAELTGQDGLRNLQKDIKTLLDEQSRGAVRNVYFSEFIVQ